MSTEPQNMAFLTKLNLAALLFILISICMACSKGDIRNSNWFSDWQSGFRKHDLINFDNAGALTNIESQRGTWSESLRVKLPPPPSPFKRPCGPHMKANPPSPPPSPPAPGLVADPSEAT